MERLEIKILFNEETGKYGYFTDDYWSDEEFVSIEIAREDAFILWSSDCWEMSEIAEDNTFTINKNI